MKITFSQYRTYKVAG